MHLRVEGLNPKPLVRLHHMLQVLLGRPCKASSDIYSFGVIMWEIAWGVVPVRGRLRPIR